MNSIKMNEQLEIAFDSDPIPPPLPEILTLREFVAQLEPEHAEQLQALRLALGEKRG